MSQIKDTAREVLAEHSGASLYHPGRPKAYYREATSQLIAGQNEPSEPTVTVSKRYLTTLLARAEKASRRRAANRVLHRAYLMLKAENASLRNRLDNAVDRIIELELRGINRPV